MIKSNWRRLERGELPLSRENIFAVEFLRDSIFIHVH
jgi:hypothetical protein